MVLRPGQFRQSFRGSAKKQKRQERNDSPIAENANEGEDEQQPSRTASEAEGRPDEVRKRDFNTFKSRGDHAKSSVKTQFDAKASRPQGLSRPQCTKDFVRRMARQGKREMELAALSWAAGK